MCLSVLIITRSSMTEQDFENYGWPFPFLFSAILVMLCYFIRRRLPETPHYQKLQAEGNLSKTPVKESFKTKGNVRLMLLAIFGGGGAQSALMQTTHFVMLYFLQRTVFLSLDTTLLIIIVATILGCPFFQFLGGLSDKIGRKAVILSGLILSTILIPLTFYYILQIGNPNGLNQIHAIGNAEIVKLILMIACLHICCAMVYGPLGAFILELFPTRIRFTSMGLLTIWGMGYSEVRLHSLPNSSGIFFLSAQPCHLLQG